MKKYVQPDVKLILLEYHDICATSGEGQDSAEIKNNLSLNGYSGFEDGLWL